MVRACGAINTLTSKGASRHKGVHLSTSQLPEVVQACCAFNILTSTCVSRHNSVRLLIDVSTSKSGPGLRCFAHFDLTCASCQDYVLFFDTSTSKSGPDLVCFVHFDLECASCHNGVQFFISHLASWLHPRRLSEPTFRPSGLAWEKHSVSRLSCFIDLLFRSLLPLTFSLTFFSDSSHMCFSCVHSVGSLTSRLPPKSD